MDENELRAIEKRANAATGGPWHAGLVMLDGKQCVCVQTYGGDIDGNPPEYEPVVFTSPADAEFIAEARTDVPALVAEVRRLTAETQRMRSALVVIQSHADVARIDTNVAHLRKALAGIATDTRSALGREGKGQAR